MAPHSKSPASRFSIRAKQPPHADIGDPYLPEGLSPQGEGDAEVWPKDDAASIPLVNLFGIRSGSYDSQPM